MKSTGDFCTKAVYYYICDTLGNTRLIYKGSVLTFKATTYKPFGTAYGVTGTEKFTFAGEMKCGDTCSVVAGHNNELGEGTNC